MSQSQTGIVKWFSDQRSFGFIAPDDGGQDVFVHASAVNKAGLRTLGEGQKIRYEIQRDPKTGKNSAAELQEAA